MFELLAILKCSFSDTPFEKALGGETMACNLSRLHLALEPTLC